MTWPMRDEGSVRCLRGTVLFFHFPANKIGYACHVEEPHSRLSPSNSKQNATYSPISKQVVECASFQPKDALDIRLAAEFWKRLNTAICRFYYLRCRRGAVIVLGHV
jgi:hypothetical protein